MQVALYVAGEGGRGKVAWSLHAVVYLPLVLRERRSKQPILPPDQYEPASC